MLDITRAYGLDFLFPARDLTVGASLRDNGEFARPEADIIARLMMAGEGPGTYLDVGANIGSIALPIAAAQRHNRVIAIEGNRHIATILAANALGNRLGNVDVIHAAAGATPGLMRFPMPPMDSALNFGGIGVGVQLHPSQTEENVRVCTLDEVAPANTRVVKLDVEGFEGEVLAGAGGLIAARQASWVIEHKGNALAHALTGQFLDAGYTLFWLYAPFVTPAAPKAAGPIQQAKGDVNFLAMPSGEPPVRMVRITAPDDVAPKTLAGYPYLTRFGWSSPPAEPAPPPGL